MNAFTTVRRILWSILLAACIVFVTLYLAVSTVFLSTTHLEQIAKRAELAQTIRNEVILPKILAATNESRYAALLDEATVTQIFNQTIPVGTFEQKISPAITSLQSWLDSKEPTISFSIDTSDLSNRFADQLAQAAVAKITSLPPCTANNSLADAENGTCRSGFISQAALSRTITVTIKDDAALISATITPSDIPLPPTVQQIGSDLPAYMNMFYAASIITAGIAVMITLWLLFKHRISGLITIGSSLVLAAGVLFISSLMLMRYIREIDTNALSTQLIQVAGAVFKEKMQEEALLLLFCGGALIVSMSIIKIVLLRRSRRDQPIHLSDHKE